MSAKLQPVRGTHDMLPEEARHFCHVVETARGVAERYGYGEIMTPIFEFSEVFHRTLGDTSDVVTKETYTFTDRGGESLTLRPEFTAGIARAFISGGLANELPLKLFAAGPAFRYERPQKGRYRQFHQIDAELLGVAEPIGDVEMIAMAHDILAALGLKDKVKLEINTLGDAESRANYREMLVKYFTGHETQLSDDSKARLTRNPLRILDSKDEGDRKIIIGAPRFNNHLTSAAQEYFRKVLEGLAALGIKTEVNDRLVRGLDYYNHTVFEFTTDLLGTQGTVLAGGRYDGLIELMGGPPTPGIGFGAGIERLMELYDWQASPVKVRRPVALVPLGEKAELEALKSAHWLRKEGYGVELAYKGNLGNRMKKANRANASVALIFGDNELAKRAVTFKDLDKGEQKEIALSDLMTALAPYKDRH